MPNAKPVGYADDGAQVAGVLHTVEGKTKFVQRTVGEQGRAGDVEGGQHLLRMLQKTHLAQFVVGHGHIVRAGSHAHCFIPLCGGDDLHRRGHRHEVGHHLGAFGHKQPLFHTVLFQFQRPYMLDNVLAYHVLMML